MTTFSYLSYLDDFSEDSRKKFFEQSKLSYLELSEITGFSVDTMKRWFDSSHRRFDKNPSVYSWNLAIYKLEARLKGYATLTDLIKSL